MSGIVGRLVARARGDAAVVAPVVRPRFATGAFAENRDLDTSAFVANDAAAGASARRTSPGSSADPPALHRTSGVMPERAHVLQPSIGYERPGPDDDRVSSRLAVRRSDDETRAMAQPITGRDPGTLHKDLEPAADEQARNASLDAWLDRLGQTIEASHIPVSAPAPTDGGPTASSRSPAVRERRVPPASNRRDGRAAASRSSQQEPSPPDVHVTIGRVEVRAIVNAPPPVPQPQRDSSGSHAKRTTLEQHLAGRGRS